MIFLNLNRPSSLTGSYLHYPLLMVVLGCFLYSVRGKLTFPAVLAFGSVFGRGLGEAAGSDPARSYFRLLLASDAHRAEPPREADRYLSILWQQQRADQALRAFDAVRRVVPDFCRLMGWRGSVWRAQPWLRTGTIWR